MKLLKETGIDLADVAATSDYIVGLELSADEKNCRTKDPVVLVQDLDVTLLRSLLVSNIIASVVALALLQFDCFSCQPLIGPRLRQPLICTLMCVLSMATFWSVRSYDFNLVHYISNLNYVMHAYNGSCFASFEAEDRFKPEIPKWQARIKTAQECQKLLRVPMYLHISLVAGGIVITGLSWISCWRESRVYTRY